ncbi:MAG: hypothetical protein KU29_13240 [Sulfurovum sp. FS06-10]|nr:MAG: hypothetical protein KU29_13240 [Sulfurovum sp. FS06-10]
MEKLKYGLLSLMTTILVGCGSDTFNAKTAEFDMWDYMTASSNYEVSYDVYTNGAKTDDYQETNRISPNLYTRESSEGTTTLELDNSIIIMREPSQDTEIQRYVRLGDSGVFHSSAIALCSVDTFYSEFPLKASLFTNVLKIACTMKSGAIQELYYGYNEGIVALSSDDGIDKIEYVKVGENEIF